MKIKLLFGLLLMCSTVFAQQSQFIIKPIIDPSLELLTQITPSEDNIVHLYKYVEDAQGNEVDRRIVSISLFVLRDKKMNPTQTILVLKELEKIKNEVKSEKIYRLENKDCPFIHIVGLDRSEYSSTNSVEFRYICGKKTPTENALYGGDWRMTILEDSSGNLTSEIEISKLGEWKW